MYMGIIIKENCKMEHFLDTTETIGKGLGFKHFDALHISWLIIFVIIASGTAFLYKRCCPDNRKRMRFIIAGLLIADEIYKCIGLIVGGNYIADYLPLHLCSINIFLIAIHAFKRSEILDNFLYAMCMTTTLAALLFPTWTKLPLANFMHIHSFTVHILLATYPIMLVAGKDIYVDIKEVPKAILFTAILAIPIYFVNVLLNENYMFLMKADAGNPLLYFEEWFGNHLIGVPVIESAVILVLYGPFYIYRHLKNKAK